jgi:uncharacterized membrane protein YdjX (TVP38/TMEM64 family)
MVARIKRVKKSTWIRFVTGLMLLVTGAFLVGVSPLNDYVTFDNIVISVERARSNPWSASVFYVFFILAVLGLPITLFPIIGGVLFGFRIAFPMNLLACTIGAWMAFSISRFFGRDAVETILKGRLRVLDRMAAVEGFRTVLILRLLGIPPFLVANYALGLSAIRQRHYLIGTFLGISPWMALITFASHSLWEAVLVGGEKGFSAALFRIMGPMMLLSFGVIATTGILYFVKKRKATPTASHSNL